MRLFSASLLSLAMSLGAAGLAHATVLDCSIPLKSGNLGWLSDRYIFQYEPGAATAMVYDSLIQDSVGKPVEAKAKVVSARQTAFTWTVMSKNSVGRYVKMVMRATWFTGDNTMSVAGKPAGFLESFDAQGACKLK